MKDVIYDNVKLNDYVLVKEVSDSILPSISNVSLNLNRNVGSKFIRQEMGPREINVDVEILADSYKERQELVDLLAPLLFSQEEKVLTIDGRNYMAIMDGSTELDNIMYDGATTITFVAYNPIAYGETIKLNVTSNAPLVNTGNFASPAHFEIVANSVEVTIRLNNGEDFDFITVYNVVPGQIIEIDSDKEGVLVNGQNHIKDINPLGDFFQIPPGEFSLSVSGALSTLLTMQERWL